MKSQNIYKSSVNLYPPLAVSDSARDVKQVELAHKWIGTGLSKLGIGLNHS